MYVLKRTQSNEKGTFGVLSINDIPFCVTLEETWLDNQNQISCIPAGKYDVIAYSGTKYKNVWLVQEVPNRSAILIHWGNTEKNTAGCLLMGSEFDGQGGILGSMKAIDRLRKVLPKKFELEIVDCF